MNHNEQTDAFMHELDNMIGRFQREFDLNIYTIAGVLDAKKAELYVEVDINFDEDMDLDADEDDNLYE